MSGTVVTMRETLRSISSLAELALWRDGGQRQARRNAWAAMVDDARRARERAEVAAAVDHLNWRDGSHPERLPG
ncbi:MAG: hypothetical protein QOC82_3257 [Frankiaceae bacterium]|jgi:hypothetical protein|nr:hypothetical protein [Frankiaceae bacterium]